MFCKKSVFLVLTVLLFVIAAGCVHEHAFDAKVTFATCTEKGSTEYTCKCGEYYFEEIPVLGHEWDGGAVTKEATCGEEGIRTFYCKACNESKTEPVVFEGEHTWNEGEITQSQTCGADGITLITCTVCGETKTESSPATGEHTFDDGVATLEPTCSAEGVKTYTCTVCGTVKEEKLPIIGENHSWNDGTVTVEATCENKGKKTVVCTLCGSEKTEDIPTVEHSWDGGVVTKKATCSSKGKIKYTCTVCSKTATETVAKSNDHNWKMLNIGSEISMTKAGKGWFRCSDCNTGKTRDVDKLPYRDDMIDYGMLAANGMYWYLDKNGKLYIEGEGAMPDFEICREYQYAVGSGADYMRADGTFYEYKEGTAKLIREVNTVPWRNYIDKIKTVVIEDGITEISSYAFANCTNLESITIPASVERIGTNRSGTLRGYVFINCNKLKRVVAPGVKYLHTVAFGNCKNLEYVELPSLVTFLTDSFYECNIDTLVLGDTLTNLCYGAIRKSTVENIYLYGNAPQVKSGFASEKVIFSGSPVIYYAQGKTGYNTSDWTRYTLKTFNP